MPEGMERKSSDSALDEPVPSEDDVLEETVLKIKYSMMKQFHSFSVE